MRSLLHQILAKHEGLELAKDAFPERYRALYGRNANEAPTFDPRLHELRQGLMRIIKGHPSVHLFFIVDGLDEYDGADVDATLLVDHLKELAEYPNVKVLASSRPWAVFEKSFQDCLTLRVHDLTREDILHFVQDQISKNHRFVILQSKDPSAAQALVTEVAESSLGVFLWVSLVIRSLLEGLRNYDTIQDLQDRLREFPPELKDLFYHMWQQVPQRYKAQASRLRLQGFFNSSRRGPPGAKTLPCLESPLSKRVRTMSRGRNCGP